VGQPELTLWANPQVTAQFTEFGDRVHETRRGDVLSAAGFDVHVYGHDHALIHQDIPSVVNTGFWSRANRSIRATRSPFSDEPVRTLLVPIAGPWLRAGDMIDYFRAVAPARNAQTMLIIRLARLAAAVAELRDAQNHAAQAAAARTAAQHLHTAVAGRRQPPAGRPAASRTAAGVASLAFPFAPGTPPSGLAKPRTNGPAKPHRRPSRGPAPPRPRGPTR
jgi:hypothetical protein